MKRALVLSLVFVLGLGFAAFAGPLTGSWSTDITIVTPANPVITLTSLLNVDYTVSGWTFGFNTRVDEGGLKELNFDIAGNLGALGFWSFLDFDPVTPAFDNWSNAAKVSIAGVDLWALFALEAVGEVVGTGWSFGGHGTAGDIEVWVGVDFNLDATVGTIQSYGWDYLMDMETYYSCSSGAWLDGAFDVTLAGCDPAFTNLDIYVEMPFTCLDLLVNVNFDCTNGFDFIQFDLNDIYLGVSWFQLDDLNIRFTVQTKSITSVDFTLLLDSAVCLTPYFDVSMGATDYIVDGIVLRALTLSYSWNGVTFKAGEIFSYYAGFTKSGGLSTYAGCVVTNSDEFFGVEIDGDSCCGGLVDASFYTFFDLGGSTGIFDWLYFVGNASVGLGTNITLDFGLEISPTAFEALKIGFDLTW